MQQLDLLGENDSRLGGDQLSDARITLGATDPSRQSGARARARDPEAWALEPHICRHCGGGRLVSQATDQGRRYLCTNCGAEAHGGPATLCFCGLRVRRNGPLGGFLDPGVRCHENPAPTPAFPSVIVASERPPGAETDS